MLYDKKTLNDTTATKQRRNNSHISISCPIIFERNVRRRKKINKQNKNISRRAEKLYATRWRW